MNDRLVTLQLPPDTDPTTLGVTLSALVDILAAGSPTAARLGHLAAQLQDHQRLTALRVRVEKEREERERHRLRQQLDACWLVILDEDAHHRAQPLAWPLFLTEWDKYPDPSTGRPYPLSADSRTRRRVMRLGMEGVPWAVVRDIIHDVLTTADTPTLETVVRRCRRHVRRQQERALRLIEGGES